MSDSYEIRYLKTAEEDLDEIFDYILNDRPTAVVSVLEKFDESISRLVQNPEIGVVPKDERLKSLGYRMLIIDKYLVFYVIKGKVVQIRRIIHGARQYNHLI
ncbi:type II toxin-antitoxin system RelE/ParE family toxin [bacterium]|nr:type II toxin-antitoxin system RelE/ParE family toxin [bacterium]